jgi:hypothetical protein
MGFWATPKFFAPFEFRRTMASVGRNGGTWERKRRRAAPAPPLLGGGGVNPALLLASLLAASPDLAAPPAPSPATTQAPPTATAGGPVETTGWYGQPAAIVDGGSVALLLTGAALAGEEAPGYSTLAPPLVLLGIGGFAFMGPVNHVHNRHYWRATASLGLRLAATLTAGFILLDHELHGCTDDIHPTGCDKWSAAQLAGLAAPFVVAAALDDFGLARGTIPAREPRPAQTGPTITPVVGPSWAMLSLGGTF